MPKWLQTPSAITRNKRKVIVLTDMLRLLLKASDNISERMSTMADLFLYVLLPLVLVLSSILVPVFYHTCYVKLTEKM